MADDTGSTHDKVFYLGDNRDPSKKKTSINRSVYTEDDEEYKMDDEDNHRKSKQEKKIEEDNDIKTIIKNTRSDVEELYNKHRDIIINKYRFKDLKPDTIEYKKAKDSISNELKLLEYRCKVLLDKTIFERISEYKSDQRHLPTVFDFSKKAEPIYEDEIPNLWKTPDEMKKTQEEINDLGRKIIAKGKRLSPKFFGELENYSSDEDDDTSASAASSSSSSASPSISNSAASSSASASPSTSASTPGLKSILKRKREGGRKTKKHKKSRVRKSRVRKSKARK